MKQTRKSLAFTGFVLVWVTFLPLQADVCDHPRAMEYKNAAPHALASEYAYSRDPAHLPPGFKPSKDWADYNILNLSGISYVVLKNEATGEVILAFRGTNNPTDAVNDALQGVGLPSPQYFQALEVASMLQAKYKDKLVVTGHSLGGGEAAYVGSSLGIPFVTFNAAPVHPFYDLPDLLGLVNPNGTNFHHEHDLVYDIPGMHPGEDVKLTDAGDYTTRPYPTYSDFGGITDLFANGWFPDIGGVIAKNIDALSALKEAALDAHSMSNFRKYLAQFMGCPDPIFGGLPGPGAFLPPGPSGNSGSFTPAKLQPFR